MTSGVQAAAVKALVVAMALPLAGCFAVGPDFASPEPDAPPSYAAAVPEQFRDGPRAERWWTLFGDPVLDDLVAHGLEGSLDVQVAASRVREARATARASGARLFPTLDLSGEAAGEWRTQRGRSSSSRTFSGDGGDDRTASAEAAAVIGWDLDVFGGLQRAREAAEAEALRQAALTREAERVVVVGIARAYVELRAAQRRLELTDRSLELQQRTLDVVREQVDAGLAPGLDQVRAEAAVSGLRADVGPLGAEIAQFGNAIAVLAGRPPGALDAALGEAAPIPAAERPAAIGAPLDLVRRRPDIRAAELQIAAATAEVGVEEADLYPSFSLPGVLSIGVSGLGADTLVTTVLRTLSLTVDIPLFDAGARAAEVTAAEERVVQAALLYRDTLLAALEEVEAALLDYRAARDRREALAAQVDSSRRAFEQSRSLYQQGLIDFLDVLDSQREWNAVLQELALAERDLTLAIVDVYAAIGGPPPGPVSRDLPGA